MVVLDWRVSCSVHSQGTLATSSARLPSVLQDIQSSVYQLASLPKLLNPDCSRYYALSFLLFLAWLRLQSLQAFRQHLVLRVSDCPRYRSGKRKALHRQTRRPCFLPGCLRLSLPLSRWCPRWRGCFGLLVVQARSCTHESKTERVAESMSNRPSVSLVSTVASSRFLPGRLSSHLPTFHKFD